VPTGGMRHAAVRGPWWPAHRGNAACSSERRASPRDELATPRSLRTAAQPPRVRSALIRGCCPRSLITLQVHHKLLNPMRRSQRHSVFAVSIRFTSHCIVWRADRERCAQCCDVTGLSTSTESLPLAPATLRFCCITAAPGPRIRLSGGCMIKASITRSWRSRAAVRQISLSIIYSHSMRSDIHCELLRASNARMSHSTHLYPDGFIPRASLPTTCRIFTDNLAGAFCVIAHGRMRSLASSLSPSNDLVTRRQSEAGRR
jgi:hypothetical protein